MKMCLRSQFVELSIYFYCARHLMHNEMKDSSFSEGGSGKSVGKMSERSRGACIVPQTCPLDCKRVSPSNGARKTIARFVLFFLLERKVLRAINLHDDVLRLTWVEIKQTTTAAMKILVWKHEQLSKSSPTHHQTRCGFVLHRFLLFQLAFFVCAFNFEKPKWKRK